MTAYLVTWQIDVEADSPREAAERARAIQLDPDSIANVFDVQRGPHAKACTIDLEMEEGE